jgi:O-antigen/teichoic acid export membrane protein
MLTSFINRTVFIYFLEAGYLGVSGLFTNVLGLLSFSELGIGTAINYSLYKPIANNDTEKIKSLMRLYKIAYRIIAVCVCVMGLVLFPFLKYLVNTDISMMEIQIYYWIFLFNTVSSYFVTYKTSYVSAIQKDYIVTNINTIGQIVIYISQIVGIFIFKNYLTYLLIQALIGVVQKVFTVIYINRKFPILTENVVQPVDDCTRKELFKNVKALVIHKLGDISVHQTDNIIISVLVNTVTVGFVSNYTTLSGMVTRFTNVIFNSFTASLGNLIAIETPKKQKEIFETFDFIGFWIFGFVTISFITLVQPFITLWIGRDMLIDDFTMVLFFTTIYLEGQSLTVNNFKVAAGRFDDDKWVAFVQTIVNLIVSIIAVKLIGLTGVYIGTIAQRLIVNIVRPLIVYKEVLHDDVTQYFRRFVGRAILITILCILLKMISNILITDLSVWRFFFLGIISTFFSNGVIFLIYRNSPMMKLVLGKLGRK